MDLAAWGDVYLEFSDDLKTWEELDDSFTGTGELSEYTDTFGIASGVPRRYYRVTEL